MIARGITTACVTTCIDSGKHVYLTHFYVAQTWVFTDIKWYKELLGFSWGVLTGLRGGAQPRRRGLFRRGYCLLLPFFPPLLRTLTVLVLHKYR